MPHHGGDRTAKLGAPLAELVSLMPRLRQSFSFFDDGQKLVLGKQGPLNVGSPCSSMVGNPTFEHNYYQWGFTVRKLVAAED